MPVSTLGLFCIEVLGFLRCRIAFSVPGDFLLCVGIIPVIHNGDIEAWLQDVHDNRLFVWESTLGVLSLSMTTNLHL